MSVNVRSQQYRWVWLFLLAFDLAVRQWAVWDGRVIWNRGGVLGLWPSHMWLGMLPIWGVLLVAWIRRQGMEKTGLGLIVTGGGANLIDRIWFGAVRDYIYYPILEIYGNMADIMLLLGVLILVWPHIRRVENE